MSDGDAIRSVQQMERSTVAARNELAALLQNARTRLEDRISGEERQLNAVLKIAIFGASGSGRSSLLQRIATGQFVSTLPSNDRQEVSPVLDLNENLLPTALEHEMKSHPANLALLASSSHSSVSSSTGNISLQSSLPMNRRAMRKSRSSGDILDPNSPIRKYRERMKGGESSLNVKIALEEKPSVMSPETKGYDAKAEERTDNDSEENRENEETTQVKGNENESKVGETLNEIHSHGNENENETEKKKELEKARKREKEEDEEKAEEARVREVREGHQKAKMLKMLGEEAKSQLDKGSGRDTRPRYKKLLGEEVRLGSVGPSDFDRIASHFPSTSSEESLPSFSILTSSTPSIEQRKKVRFIIPVMKDKLGSVVALEEGSVLSMTYYHGALLVYNPLDAASLDFLKTWWPGKKSDEKPSIVIGVMSDLLSSKGIDPNAHPIVLEAAKWASSFEMKHLLVSCATGENILEMVSSFLEEVVAARERRHNSAEFWKARIYVERMEFRHFINQAENLLASMMMSESPAVSLELKKMLDGRRKKNDGEKEKDKEKEKEKGERGLNKIDFITPRSKPDAKDDRKLNKAEEKAREKERERLMSLTPVEVISDPLGLPELQLFFKSEHSEEYLLFYLAVEHHRLLPMSAWEDSANVVYSQFIAEGSPHQVAISSNVRKEIQDSLEAKAFSAEMFDEAQKEVLVTIKFNWRRFFTSEYFEAYVIESTKRAMAEVEKMRQRMKDERAASAVAVGFRGISGAPREVDPEALERKKQKLRDQIIAQPLEISLKDDSIANGFREFMSKEMAVENLDFLLELEKVAECRPEEVPSRCKEIFAKYISSPSSRYQVNISAASVTAIKESLKAGKIGLESYASAKIDVLRVLQPSAMRYFDTPAFAALVELKAKEYLRNRKPKGSSKKGSSSKLSRSNPPLGSSPDLGAQKEKYELPKDFFSQNSMKTHLSDPGGAATFRKYLELRYCPENLDFYVAVEKLKATPDSNKEEVERMAHSIFEEFFAPDAPSTLNLPMSIRREIGEYKLSNPTKSAFDAAQREAFKMMYMNDWGIYLESPQFKAFRTLGGKF